ncbi:MAG: lytic transglycosylase domain-containing protein [Streptosporangiaceae bacterium]
MRRSVAGCGALVLIGVGAYSGMFQPPSGGSAGAPAAAAAASQAAATSFRQIILPDLLIVSPAGLTSQQLTRLNKISGVRNMIAFDGAEIKTGGRPVSVIGVNPAQFRSWVPLQTASDQPFWTALASGEFAAATTARKSLGLRAGASYQLTGATTQPVRFGGAASLGIEGVDLLVDSKLSAELGLVHRVAALISAPGIGLTKLITEVKAVLGPSGKIVSLRQQQLPVTKVASNKLPTTYLQLFQDSAAKYCPGLSWTVLAAIGQIESADGTNDGPSPAGALGPMQFEPSTWAAWGIDAFGQTGPPNIMNPYDAVPSAARMLCADGAAAGGAALSAAIFDYNHANWYVSEVLSLAAEYAQENS